jgi:hypothetical protein
VKPQTRGLVGLGGHFISLRPFPAEIIGREMPTPLKREQTKCEALERELRRSPDFQLYLLTESGSDRARMERMLVKIPQFALWRMLMMAVRSVPTEL